MSFCTVPAVLNSIMTAVPSSLTAARSPTINIALFEPFLCKSSGKNLWVWVLSPEAERVDVRVVNLPADFFRGLALH